MPILLRTAATLALLATPLAVHAQSAGSTGNSPAASQQGTIVAGTADATRAEDRTFIAEAAAGGMFEIKSSQTALQRSQNAEVKSFAQKMIDEHTQLSGRLKEIASTLDAPPPTELPAEIQQKLTALQGQTGPAFDREYLTAQVEGHQKTVKLFQKEAQQGTQPQLKSFAAQSLPTIEHHLEMVQALQANVNATASR